MMMQNAPRKSRKSSKRALALIGGSEAIAQGAAIVRRLIILRTIGVENYGIAVPMLLVLGLLNRVLEINPASTLIQDPRGSTRRFRDALQFVSLMRGVVFCTIVVLLAVPLAVFNDLDTREYVLAFMFIGIVPLIRGFCHIDVFRQLRRRQYGTTAFMSTVSPVITTTIIAIMCLFMNSFWVPLIGKVIDSITAVFMSFWVSKRSYRMRYDRASTVRILKFSIPLIVGGVIIFLAQQGPKQLVSASESLFGYEISKSDLGILASAMLLAMMPGSIGAKVVTQVFSPKIAEIKRSGRNLVAAFDQIQAFAFILGTATMILLQGGSTILPLLLGGKWSAAGPYLVAFSLFSALRISGASTRSAILALGRSKIIMYSNLWTLVGLACSALVVYNQRPLMEIAYCMALGEILASLSRCIMLKRIVPEIRVSTLVVLPTMALASAFGIGIAQTAITEGCSMMMSIVVILVSVVLGTAAISLIWPSVRAMIAGRTRS